MASEFGKNLRISVFGQSHGTAIGVCMDGLPPGEPVDAQALSAFMARRRPGQSALTTPRKEADEVLFLSGVENGLTCGAPLCAVIQNTNVRSQDYTSFADTPRPGHADYTASVRYDGKADLRGGGHFSGRLTAPLCIAGGIAAQILGRRGVEIGAHIAEIHGISDDDFPLEPTKALFERIQGKEIAVINDEAGARMAEEIRLAASKGDSLGGTIACAAIGVPPGWGNPMFDGMENRLAAALFGIPGVKGVSFGSGFDCAKMTGSEHNDSFCIDDGQVRTKTNRHGGILGGISSGMPVTLCVALKPTPSIAKTQQTVSLSQMKETELAVKGRHDPCIVLRAVPVVEAVTACVLLDFMLEER